MLHVLCFAAADQKNAKSSTPSVSVIDVILSGDQERAKKLLNDNPELAKVKDSVSYYWQT